MWTHIPPLNNLSEEDVAFLHYFYVYKAEAEDIPMLRKAFKEQYNVEAPEWVRP